MAAVIFDLASAMPTREDRRADTVEGLGLALAVIEKAVAAGVEAAGYWQAGADLDSDPVPELKALLV